MNRKQKKTKIKRATYHKIKCKWLNGGNPRQYRKSTGRLWYRIRLSRKRMHKISVSTMNRYMQKAELL